MAQHNRSKRLKQWAELRKEFERQDEEERVADAYRTVHANLLSNAERFEKNAQQLEEKAAEHRKLADDLPFGKDE